MNIAELFVTIGLGGGAKTTKELDGVGRGLVGVSKKGLAAFAAIAGISYGLRQLAVNALNSGNSLTKFGNFTGLSAEKLQQWQYIARQSGVAADEVKTNVESLAGSLAEMQKTGEFSGEFLRMAEFVDIDMSKLNDAFYMLEKFREFSKSNLPTGQVNSILGSFLSPDMIQMLRTSTMTPDQVPNGAITSDAANKRLQRAQVALANLQSNVEKSFGKVFAEVAPQLVTKLNDLIPNIERLTKAVLLSIGNFSQFWSNPTGEMGKLFEGLLDPVTYKTMLDDIFTPSAEEQAASIKRIKEAMNRPRVGIQDQLAADISRRKGESPAAPQIILNQTNNGMAARDANVIADRTVNAVKKAPAMQLKTVKAVN